LGVYQIIYIFFQLFHKPPRIPINSMSVLFLTPIHIISFTSVTIPPIFQQNE